MRATSTSPQAVRYQKDNTLEQGRLRLALFQVWHGRCAWCQTLFGDPSFVSVDHILPRKHFENERHRFGFADDETMHDVENLAPMCGSGRGCNRRKGANVYSHATEELLRAARDVAGDVRRRVALMRAATGLDLALETSAGAPLNARNRRVIGQWANLLVQRIHTVDPRYIEAYVSMRYLDLPELEDSPEPGCFIDDEDEYQAAALELDAGGREAYAVARVTCDADLDEVITRALTTLVTELEDRVREVGLSRYDSDGGFVLSSRRALKVHTVRAATNSDGQLVVSGAGAIFSAHSASVISFDRAGEPRDGQVDVTVEGPFTFEASTDLLSSEFEVELDHTDVDVTRD
jgi:hypothetical protein